MVLQMSFKGADHLLNCANEASENLLNSLKEASNHVVYDPDSMAPLPESPQLIRSPRLVSLFKKLLPSAVSRC